MKLNILSASLLLLGLAACQPKEYPVDVPVYTDVNNLVTIDEATAGIGGIYTVKSMNNFTYGIKGMEYGDEVKLRYQPTGELMAWSWGYQYLGILTGEETDEELASLLIANGRKYQPDTITMGYNLIDQWKFGLWDLLVCRGSESQVIGTFDCRVLVNDSVATARANGGVIGIYADGWQQGEDTLMLIDKATGEVVLSMIAASNAESSSTNVMNMTFVTDSIGKTGTYTLRIKRWQYDMKQDLADIEFFYYQYAEPAFAKEGDAWYINIMLDEVVSGDRIVVGYNGNRNSFTHNISAENFNAQTNVYRIPISAAALKDGETYAVMLRKSAYNVNLGERTLDMSSVN